MADRMKMVGTEGRKNGFIMQAGILAAAGIISRIIGLLYRGPLHNVIGALGWGYYGSAYNYYTIILLISSYSIPSAISKVIAQKLAVKEYRNAHRIFKCALGYVLAVGGVASLFLFFGAGIFVEGAAVTVLKTFAPTIFIYGILGVLRGYFQAHRSMVQTSISQILEQIANAVVSVGAAYLLIRINMGGMELPIEEAGLIKRATYGAVGSALGTGAGVLAALLFMLGVYGLNRGMIYKRIKHDRHTSVDSYQDILKVVTMVVMPYILSTAVYNLSSAVNNSVYMKAFLERRNLSEMELSSRWGVFVGQAQTISNIPIAFATAMGAAMIPTVAQSIASNDLDGTKEKIATAVKMIMMISIPCAMGLFVLARPVTGLLFHNTEADEDLATKLLMALSLSVIFYALSTLSNHILQGMGKVNIPIINAGIALVIQTAVGVWMVGFTGLDLYAIAIANTIYSGIMCVLNQIAVYRVLGYRQEMLTTFVVPLLASVLMGALAWAVYEGMLMLTSSPRISVIIAILLAMCIYFALLLLFRGVTEEELRGFPKGHLLVKVAKRCRLMK